MIVEILMLFFINTLKVIRLFVAQINFSEAPAEPPYLKKYGKPIKARKHGCHVMAVFASIRPHCLIMQTLQWYSRVNSNKLKASNN